MRVLGVVTALTVMASPVVAQAPPSADSAAIVRLELELTHLLETGQFDRYAEHLTDDYALTAADGQLLSRAEALIQWRARGPGTRMTPEACGSASTGMPRSSQQKWSPGARMAHAAGSPSSLCARASIGGSPPCTVRALAAADAEPAHAAGGRGPARAPPGSGQPAADSGP